LSPDATCFERTDEMTMNTDSPAWGLGLMPPDIPVAEVRYYPPMAEQAHVITGTASRSRC